MKKEVNRVFVKHLSVFASWEPDSTQTYSQVVDHDFKFWKINSKIITDPVEYAQVVEEVKQEIGLLKNIYLDLLTNSISFPYIGQ